MACTSVARVALDELAQVRLQRGVGRARRADAGVVVGQRAAARRPRPAPARDPAAPRATACGRRWVAGAAASSAAQSAWRAAAPASAWYSGSSRKALCANEANRCCRRATTAGSCSGAHGTVSRVAMGKRSPAPGRRIVNCPTIGHEPRSARAVRPQLSRRPLERAPVGRRRVAPAHAPPRRRRDAVRAGRRHARAVRRAGRQHRVALLERAGAGVGGGERRGRAHLRAGVVRQPACRPPTRRWRWSRRACW